MKTLKKTDNYTLIESEYNKLECTFIVRNADNKKTNKNIGFQAYMERQTTQMMSNGEFEAYCKSLIYH